MHILLYNPLSRNGHGKTSLDEAIEFIATKEYETINILEITDYLNLFDSYSVEDTFVVIGGDGTYSRFINAIPLVPHKIMFFAGGTGNDFMRNFPGELAEYSSDIDKPVVTTDKAVKMVNTFGTGVDSLVIEYYDNSKSKSKLSYFYYTLKAFLSYKPITVNVDIDGEKHTFNRTYLVSIQNGKYFGGGMTVAPDAEVNDGLLDICIVHNISRLKLFFVFPSIYSGSHLKFTKHVLYTQGKKIHITQDTPRTFTSDGELSEKVYHNFKIEL